MSTAENLVMVALDPQSGRNRVSSMNADAVVGGAFLIDLVTQGRLGLEGTGRTAKVVVLDHTPVADPVLQAGFERIRNKGRQAPKSAVTTLGRKGLKNTVASLEAAGRLRRRPARALGIIPLTRYDVVDPAQHASLVHAVRQVLLTEHPADATTGPLVGLLHAVDRLGFVVDRSDRKQAKARAKVVSSGDWASEGVRQAIAAANAAVMTAIVASTAATTAST